jgi:hypothetical protein
MDLPLALSTSNNARDEPDTLQDDLRDGSSVPHYASEDTEPRNVSVGFAPRNVSAGLSRSLPPGGTNFSAYGLSGLNEEVIIKYGVLNKRAVKGR